MILIDPKLIILLPPEIIDYLLIFVGYHKWRNGIHITQLYEINKTYDYLKKIPLFNNYQVQLYVKTEWFNKSFCDKIITLNTNTDYNNTKLRRIYDCSWYSYDNCNAMQLINNESVIITFNN